MFFGTDEVWFEVTGSCFDCETRHFDRLSQPLQEIMDARIWAGLHCRTADVQGRILGETIVDYMAENYSHTVSSALRPPDTRDLLKGVSHRLT